MSLSFFSCFLTYLEISAIVPKVEAADDADKFQGVMDKFLEKAREDVAQMNKDFTQAMEAYNKVHRD
jgi:hypothetical protein